MLTTRVAQQQQRRGVAHGLQLWLLSSVVLCFSIVRSVLCFSFAGFIEIIILIIGNKQRARKFACNMGQVHENAMNIAWAEREDSRILHGWATNGADDFNWE